VRRGKQDAEPPVPVQRRNNLSPPSSGPQSTHGATADEDALYCPAAHSKQSRPRPRPHKPAIVGPVHSAPPGHTCSPPWWTRKSAPPQCGLRWCALARPRSRAHHDLLNQLTDLEVSKLHGLHDVRRTSHTQTNGKRKAESPCTGKSPHRKARLQEPLDHERSFPKRRAIKPNPGAAISRTTRMLDPYMYA
jgi:hypothetical protein